MPAIRYLLLVCNSIHGGVWCVCVCVYISVITLIPNAGYASWERAEITSSFN